MKSGDAVILSAKTRHGKNRISQHGKWWIVDKLSTDRLFQGGGGVLLKSDKCECPTCQKWGQDWRWVRLKDDPNFEIESGEA